jgi:hypothetical protein
MACKCDEWRRRIHTCSYLHIVPTQRYLPTYHYLSYAYDHRIGCMYVYRFVCMICVCLSIQMICMYVHMPRRGDSGWTDALSGCRYICRYRMILPSLVVCLCGTNIFSYGRPTESPTESSHAFENGTVFKSQAKIMRSLRSSDESMMP